MLSTCESCNARVSVRIHGEYQHGDPRDGPPLKAILASCPECYEPMLLGAEYYGHNNDREVWSDPWRMYPADAARLSPAIPRDLADDYLEAQASFRAQAYTASVVMCRKVLETTAAQLGIRERTLAAALSRMKDEGHIDAQLYEWASELRLVGNRAAHDVASRVSRLDAEDVMAFTEAIIDYLFVYRQRFREFTDRRAAQDASALDDSEE